MNKIFALILATTLSVAVFAQPRTTFIEYQKASKQGVALDMPYTVEISEKTVEDKMKNLGFKSKTSAGYKVYKAVKIAELGTETYDLFFKVDKKSKKDKTNATITMLVSKGNENFVTEADDITLISNAKSFLGTFINAASSYDLDLQIKEQEDLVKKTEKQSFKLTDDADDLQKKKRNLEKDIEVNIKDQGIQKTEIEKQQIILNNLRAKRQA